MNPRLPLCESGDHTGLIYRPIRSLKGKIYAEDLEVSVTASAKTAIHLISYAKGENKETSIM